MRKRGNMSGEAKSEHRNREKKNEGWLEEKTVREREGEREKKKVEGNADKVIQTEKKFNSFKKKRQNAKTLNEK